MKTTNVGVCAVLALLGPVALAGVDVGVGNADKVSGTISPADATETLRVRVPKDARISITVKGVRIRKGGRPPRMGFDVLGPEDEDLGAGEARGNGARLTLTAPSSGEYRVVLHGDGVNTGNYKAAVKWKSLRSVPFEGELTGANPTLDVAFTADEGATLGLQVKAARKSSALPRLGTLNGEALPGPKKDTAKAHKLSGLGGLHFGNSTLVVINAGADGTVRGRVKIKPPRPSKRKIAITDKTIEPDGGVRSATAEVIDASGGLVAVVGEDFGAIEGSAVDVPAGALGKPTAIVIATSPDLPPEDDETHGAGPTVFLGPEGQKFAQPVEVTIPFDPTPFAGDFSTMEVYTQSSKGKVTQITDFEVDADARTVSFFVDHFSRFRVFRRGRRPVLVRPDLNGDRVADLVVPTDFADIYVFFGGLPQAGDNDVSDADVTITGNSLSGGVLVRDVTRDGVADLIVRDGEDEGSVHVFFGKPGFAPATTGDADAAFHGGPTNSVFGAALAVGFVNGDRHPDLVVGDADFQDAAGNEFGEVYVFFGPFAGTKTVADADIVITGDADGDRFGNSVGCDDVTGDGVPDVVASADTIGRPAGRGPGFVYVYDGAQGVASGNAGSADVILAGDSDGAIFGIPMIVAHVDGDAVADIVAGDGVFSFPQRGEAITVFLGGAGLVSGTASDAVARITQRGNETFEGFGRTIFVDDIGGAAGREIVVPARSEDTPAGVNAGRTYVFDGGALVDGAAHVVASRIFSGPEASAAFGSIEPGIPFDPSIGLVLYAPNVDRAVPGDDAGRGYVFPVLPAARETDATDAPITITGRANDRLGN